MTEMDRYIAARDELLSLDSQLSGRARVNTPEYRDWRRRILRRRSLAQAELLKVKGLLLGKQTAAEQELLSAAEHLETALEHLKQVRSERKEERREGNE